MKRIILTCLLHFCFNHLSGQAYQKFVIEGAHWRIDKFYCDIFACGTGIYLTDTYHNFYKLEGDTMIDSVNYKKLYLGYWAECPECASNNIRTNVGSQPYQVVAYLTEDTLQRKVFWIPVRTWGCDRNLFMDFSWTVSDTINFTFITNDDYSDINAGDYGDTVCTRGLFLLDSMNFTGFQNYHVRTKYLDNLSTFAGQPYGNYGNLRQFEGIGFSYGFDIEYLSGDAIDIGSQLIYYCVGSDSICPELPNAINTIPSDDINVGLIPNPASNKVIIKTAGLHINKVDVLDINGRKVLTSELSEFDISHLVPAIYFVIIQTNLGIARRTLVKY